MGKTVDRARLSYRLAFSAAVAGLMSMLIGGAFVLIRWDGGGLAAAFDAWISTAPIAFAVAFPTSFFVVPIVQHGLDRLFATRGDVS